MNAPLKSGYFGGKLAKMVATVFSIASVRCSGVWFFFKRPSFAPRQIS
jgi:hypothetical protein